MVLAEGVGVYVAAWTDGYIFDEKEFVDLQAELGREGEERSFGYFIRTEIEELSEV